MHPIRLAWATATVLALLAPRAAHAQTTNQAPPYPPAPSTAPPASAVAAPPPAGTPPTVYQTPYPGSAPPAAAPYPGSAPYPGAPYPGSAPYPGAPYPGAAPYAGAPYGGAPDAARNAYVQNLRWQRQAVLAQPVTLALPITLIAVGLGVAVVGSTLASSLDDCDDYDDYDGYSCEPNPGVFAGVAMAVGGVVLASVGTGQLIRRLIRRGRQRRNLQRIDTELYSFGATATLAPWMTRTATSSAGGLTARLQF